MISTKHFDESVRPKLLAETVRRVKRELRFWAPDVVAAWVSSRVSKLEGEIRDVRAAAAEDPLMAAIVGGDSVGLERYRLAKAQIAEWEVEKLRGKLVDVAQVQGAVLSMAAVLRRYGEILAQRFGDEAAAVMSEAVDEWASGALKLLKKDDGDPAATAGTSAGANGAGGEPGGKAAADPVDAPVR